VRRSELRVPLYGGPHEVLTERVNTAQSGQHHKRKGHEERLGKQRVEQSRASLAEGDGVMKRRPDSREPREMRHTVVCASAWARFGRQDRHVDSGRETIESPETLKEYAVSVLILVLEGDAAQHGDLFVPRLGGAREPRTGSFRRHVLPVAASWFDPRGKLTLPS
jgi:hypothetical protein